MSEAMLVAGDLPGRWRTTDVPPRRGGGVVGSSSACGEATSELEEEARRWASAEVNVEAAWKVNEGAMMLKQEIAVDRDLEAGYLIRFLTRQAADCGKVVVVSDGVTVESQLRACGLHGRTPGLQIVQSWTASDGRSGSTRFAYLVHGHTMVVLTLTSAEAGGSCEHPAFAGIAAAAAAKIAR